MTKRLLLIPFLLASACTDAGEDSGTELPDASQQALGGRSWLENANVSTVETMVAAYNARDFATWQSKYDANMVYRAPSSRDRALSKSEQSALQVDSFLTAFPDLHLTLKKSIVEGNAVAMVYRLNGTFTGPLYTNPNLPPIQPTGLAGELNAVEVHTVSDGKIVEGQDAFDNVTYFASIGVQPDTTNFAYPPALDAAPAQPGFAALRTSAERANVELAADLLGAVNARDYASIGGMLGSNFDFVTPLSPAPLDASGFIGLSTSLATAFPDREYSVLGVIAEGKDVVIQYAVGGGHYGPLATPNGPLPATGRMTALRGTLTVKFNGGKIVEIVDTWDVANLYAQLGL